MMINNITWPECPYCGVLINDWNLLPAGLLMECHRLRIPCPSCKEDFMIAADKTVVIEAWRIKPKLPINKIGVDIISSNHDDIG